MKRVLVTRRREGRETATTTLTPTLEVVAEMVVVGPSCTEDTAEMTSRSSLNLALTAEMIDSMEYSVCGHVLMVRRNPPWSFCKK